MTEGSVGRNGRRRRAPTRVPRATRGAGLRSLSAMRHLLALTLSLLAVAALPAEALGVPEAARGQAGSEGRTRPPEAGPQAVSSADPWSLPAPIRAQTTTPPLPGTPAVAANGSGQAVAVADTGGALPDIGPHTMASVFSDGAFTDPARLTGRNVRMGPGAGGVLPYGRTRLLGAGVRDVTSESSQAVVAFGRLAPGGATLDAPRPLGPSNLRVLRTAIAVNARGDAAVVFPVCRTGSCNRVLVYLAVRRAGGSSFRSIRLADAGGPLPQVAAAVNDRGDALAVWTQGATAFARIRTAGGRLRALQRVGATVRGQHLAPSAALSRHRAELVGWLAQSVSEGDPSDGIAWVAQARDGGAFTATRLGGVPAAAGTGHYVSEAGVRVAYGSRGRAIVSWTAFDGDPATGRFSVRLAQLRGAANSPSQSLLGVHTVSDPAVDTVLSDLVVDRSGPEYVLMLAGVRGSDGSPTAAGTSVRASGGEEVAPAATGAAAPFGVHGTLLDDGRVLTVWGTGQGAAFSVRATPTAP